MRNLLAALNIIFLVTGAFAQSDKRVVEGTNFPGIFHSKNYIKNPSCAKNTVGITASGAGLSRYTGAGIIDDSSSCSLDGSASGNTYTFATTQLDARHYGQNCEFSFMYAGDASLYKAYVLQGATKVALDLALTNSGANTVRARGNFPCGTAPVTTSLVVEATSASAAPFFLAKAYVGLATNILSGPVSTDWADAGPLTITATTTAPTKGTTSADHFWYRRVGGNLEARIEYVQTLAGTAGSGDYLFTIPSLTGCSVNSSLVTFYTTAIGANPWFASNLVGGATAAINIPQSSTGLVSVYDATHVRLFVLNGPAAGAVSSGLFSLANNNSTYSAAFSVPCSGWTSQTVIQLDQANYDWTPFAPTSLNLGTPTFQACRHKRVGPDLLVSCVVTSTSAPGAEMRLGLPGSLITSTDSSKIPTNPAGAGTALPIGRVDRANGTSASDTVVLAQPGKTYVNFGIATSSNNSMVIAATVAVVLANETFTVTYRVPIEGWTENQNAPLLVGSATVKGSNTIRNLFSGFFGGSASDTTTVCSVVGNCFLQGQTANVTSVSYTTSPFRYTLTVPAGQCATPLICSWEGGGQAPNITWISNISLTTSSWTPSDGAGSGISVFGTFNCSCDLQ